MADQDGNWVVVHGLANGFAQTITMGALRIPSDEPTSAGGTESGPTPYDLLLSALGSCTSMTIGYYARRKGIPLESITVRLRHSKIHADDCAECDEKQVLLDRIERSIELSGTLSEEQRQLLLGVANRCPVHNTLTHHVRIDSRLAPEA